jgi:hypothetical protein
VARISLLNEAPAVLMGYKVVDFNHPVKFKTMKMILLKIVRQKIQTTAVMHQ